MPNSSELQGRVGGSAGKRPRCGRTAEGQVRIGFRWLDTSVTTHEKRISTRPSVGEARNIEIDRVLLACNNVNFLKASAAQHGKDGIIASGFAPGKFRRPSQRSPGACVYRVPHAHSGCRAARLVVATAELCKIAIATLAREPMRADAPCGRVFCSVASGSISINGSQLFA
jgi:hypothetical protein